MQSSVRRISERVHRIKRADGTLGWGKTRVFGVYGSDGALVEWIGSVTDITDHYQSDQDRDLILDKLCRAEAALRRDNAKLVDDDRRKNEFLGVLSHELRNILGPLRNGLYILEHAEERTEQAHRAHGILSRQLDQLGRLVDDLLDVTRISRNKMSLQMHQLDLNVLVSRTVEDFRAVYDEAGVRLEFVRAPSEVYVCADAHRLAQIVANLLHNAVKFTGAGGHVRVEVSSEPATDAAMISVADSGLGLTRETAFEDF
ncbi:MAG: ATP-binding protein [Polyangiaceae bacterium]